MASIVEQIQRDALDPQVPVSSLLRRVKLAATKLGLGAIEDWVDKELNGYTGELPEYRVLHGRPMGRNPLTGWMPIGGSVDHLSRRGNGQSVAELESLVANAKPGATLHIRYSDKISQSLDEQNDVAGWNWALEIGISRIVGILDRVRNLALDWAIELEKAGIMGNEYSFDPAEKAKAQASATTINIGTIGNFVGNLGQGNVSGDVTARIKSSDVQRIVDQLKSHVDELTSSGANAKSLTNNLEAIEQELKAEKSHGTKLRGLLTDLRNCLSAAAGNLLASGAIHALNQILATGVPAPPG